MDSMKRRVYLALFLFCALLRIAARVAGALLMSRMLRFSASIRSMTGRPVCAGFLALSVLLTSCVIIPMPPTSVAGVRDNIGGRVPGFIVPGVTTREDVLMHLGDADSFSGDQSELYYTNRDTRSGFLAFIVYGGAAGYGYTKELHRILVVEFDKAGLVHRTRFETETCSEHFIGVGKGESSRSCVTNVEPTAPEDGSKGSGPDPAP